MSANSFKQVAGRLVRNRWVQALALGIWVYLGFIGAQVIVVLVARALQIAGVDFMAIDPSVLNTVVAAVVYMLAIALVIGLPWRIWRIRTGKKLLGLTRLPDWFDVLLAPAGFVVYLLLSSVLAYLALHFFPGFNANQAQPTGFSGISSSYEYLLAFVTLVVVAPVAEEILMRGYLYGRLRAMIPTWLAALLTSVVFGLLHGQWNVGLDVFALSLILCALREVTGNIWAGILLHMLKNGLAFYVLFINPLFLHTIGG